MPRPKDRQKLGRDVRPSGDNGLVHVLFKVIGALLLAVAIIGLHPD